MLDPLADISVGVLVAVVSAAAKSWWIASAVENGANASSRSTIPSAMAAPICFFVVAFWNQPCHRVGLSFNKALKR